MMKERLLPLLHILLSVAVCAGVYLCFQVHEYLQWKAAYRGALWAYQSAYDFRDADDQIFVQRLRNFQTAMDALDRRPRYDDHLELAKEQLRACAAELDLYRRWVRLNSASMSLRSHTDFNDQRRAEKAAGSCARSAGNEGVIP
jgi:hypothetical protein